MADKTRSVITKKGRKVTIKEVAPFGKNKNFHTKIIKNEKA